MTIGYYYFDTDTQTYYIMMFKARKYITSYVFDSVKKINDFLCNNYNTDEIELEYMGVK